MDLSGNTVLVTGGASGIGLAIAERFLNAGSHVIVCGRRPDTLHAAKAAPSGLHAPADVSGAPGREELAALDRRRVPRGPTCS